MIFKKTKNKNKLKTDKNKKITSIQLLLSSLVSTWITLIYVITKLKNIFIIIFMLTFIYVNETVIGMPLLSCVVSLFIYFTGVIFTNCSVLPKKNKTDKLELLLKEIATPTAFMKFLYAKQNARLQVKQSAFIRRKFEKND